MLNQFLSWAENHHWHITIRTDNANLPAEITSRYSVPPEWLGFIENFTCCSNSADTKWFLIFEDFSADSAFRWNEFELQSLESADSDTDLKNQITSYWNKHLPIILCVDGEYAYYAIDTDNRNIVFGCEPEYEDPVLIADNLEQFLQKIIAGEIIL